MTPKHMGIGKAVSNAVTKKVPGKVLSPKTPKLGPASFASAYSNTLKKPNMTKTGSLPNNGANTATASSKS